MMAVAGIAAGAVVGDAAADSDIKGLVGAVGAGTSDGAFVRVEAAAAAAFCGAVGWGAAGA
jgi:hypothetical protein